MRKNNVKKLIIVLCFLSQCSLYSMDQEVEVCGAVWRDNFKQLQNSQSAKHVEASERWQKLGYNPDITFLKPNQEIKID